MSRLGDSMDLPYEPNPPGQTINDKFIVSGGLVIAAATVPMPDDGELKPALVFRFSSPLGEFYNPVLLVLDDDQAANLPKLVQQSVDGAREAARKAS
jgi:hypothetical protein